VDYSQFVRDAERGQLPPLVLIHGTDAQLLDDALAVATRALGPDAGQATFGREVLDARETSPEAILSSARTLPLMTKSRLVVVRRAEELSPRAEPLLAAYAADPNPATCLLLLAGEPLDGGRDGRSHWLPRAVPRAAVIVAAERRGRDLETWLKQRAQADGLDVSDEAARLLIEWVGEDTAALLGEVRKAALAGGAANQTVGRKEVSAVVGDHRVSGVFDLARAIERRDAGQALRTLDRLLETEEPMRVLAVLATETRTGWAICELGRRGQSPDAIARSVRRPPGVVAARLAALGASSTATLRRRLERCWEVEWRLKSGGEPRAELAALVVDLLD